MGFEPMRVDPTRFETLCHNHSAAPITQLYQTELDQMLLPATDNKFDVVLLVGPSYPSNARVPVEVSDGLSHHVSSAAF